MHFPGGDQGSQELLPIKSAPMTSIRNSSNIDKHINDEHRGSDKKWITGKKNATTRIPTRNIS